MPDRWEIDSNHSRFGFSARHMMVSKVRGGFDDFNGFIEIDGDDHTTAHGEFVIKAASVNSNVADRDAHLRSADFFGADRYPEIRFVSTGVEKLTDDNYKVTGDLTVKDVTRPISVDVSVDGRILDAWGNNRVGLTATTKINRKDWGLTWNMALEAGGVVVSDHINLEIEAAFLQKVPVTA
jgi:polyisoprenoid-binding protein YceI